MSAQFHARPRAFAPSLCCLVSFAGASAASPHLLSEPLAQADPKPRLELVASDAFPKGWGTTYRATMRSNVLAETRKVSIYVPSSFSSTRRRYPVIFLTDGEYDFERAVLAARQLALDGHIPECIVAAIETPNRTQDMTPPGMGTFLAGGEERGGKFLKFIAKELRPELESRLRAVGPCVLEGHSHGGILAHYAAAKWRRDFPFILSLDAPMLLADRWLVKAVLGSVPSGGHLRLVSFECTFGWTDKEWDEFRTLAPKDWKLTRRKLPDETHQTMVFTGFYEGLKELFFDYSLVSVKSLSAREAFAHYERLAKEYGAACTPPEAVLRRAVDELTIVGAAEAAHRALSALADGYGEPTDRSVLEKRIDEAAAAMKGQESVEQLLSSPRPTGAEMRPYLGVWTGVNGPIGESGTPVTLTLALKDGRGSGEFVYHFGPGEEQVSPLTYLRVTRDGIEFGFLNGIFPKGVLVHVARLSKGKLQGEVVFKGVYFHRPEEMQMPRIVFSLQRKVYKKSIGT